MGKLASVNTLSIVLLHQPKLNSITYKPIGIPFNRYLYVLPIDRYEYHIVNHLKALAGILPHDEAEYQGVAWCRHCHLHILGESLKCNPRGRTICIQ